MTGIQAIEPANVGPAAMADAIRTARVTSWTMTVIFNARTSAAATNRPVLTTMAPVAPSCGVLDAEFPDSNRDSGRS